MLRRSLLLIALLVAPAAAFASSGPEYRAFWVDAFNSRFGTRAEIDTLLDDAERAHANALFVQVRRRGDSWYADSKEPLTEVAGVGEPDGSGRWTVDPLRYLIDQAHARSIEIHAFVNVGSVWGNESTLPKDPDHVFLQHFWDAAAKAPWEGTRQWATRVAAGGNQAGTSHNGQRFGDLWYMDFGHPDAAAYTLEVFAHLVAQYDIDGIHLDRIRFPELVPDPGRAGYNAVSVARFNARHGSTGDPAPSDALWKQWRRDQVTDFVRRLYLTAKSIRPSIRVSAALISWGNGPDTGSFESTEAYRFVYQDWESWAEEGILDILMPMIYMKETEHPDWFDRWTRFLVDTARRTGRLSIAGLGSWLNTSENNLKQLERARAIGADGVAFYSFALPTTGSRAQFLTTLGSTFEPAVPPPSIANDRGGIMGFSRADGDEVVLERTGTSDRRTVRADGNRFYGFANLEPGMYRVSAGLESCTVLVDARIVSRVDLPGGCLPRRRATSRF